MTPEQIAIQVLNSQGIPLGNALEQRLAITIAAALRDYGAACASEMRERCAVTAERTVTGYTAVGDLVPASRVIAARIRALSVEPQSKRSPGHS